MELEGCRAQPSPKIDSPATSEARAGESTHRVERYQSRIDGRHKNPATARGARSSTRVKPGGNSAAREIAVAGVDVHIGIVLPDLRAALRIDRRDASERGADVEESVYEDRCDLERRGSTALNLQPELTGAVGPRGRELHDVAGVDLCEGREARPAGIAAVRWPLA